MSVKESVSVASKQQITIVGKDGISKVVNMNNSMKVVINSGDKVSLSKGENGIVENIIAIKKDADLILTFKDGETLSLENFYSFNDAEIVFTLSDGSEYTLSSLSDFGYDLADGSTLVYAQGNQSTLLSLAEGNESLTVALNEQIGVANAEHFAAAEGAVAAESGAAAGGWSTGALIAAGVVVVGGAVALSNSSSSSSTLPISSTSSSTSSGSSSSSSEGAAATGDAFFIDSAVAGVTYIRTDADGNETGRGTTNSAGGFVFAEGETITFVIINANGATITLGSIAAANINEDGNVMPQDLAGVARTNTTDADVVELAQLLQSLDSDGDASNGLQITSEKVEEFLGGQTADSTINLTNGANSNAALVDADAVVDLVSLDTATGHLNDTLRDIDSTITTDAAFSGTISAALRDINVGDGTNVVITDATPNIEELNTLQQSIGSGTITFSALTGITGNVDELIADTQFITTSVALTLDDTATVAQLEALIAKSSAVNAGDFTYGAASGLVDTIENLLNEAGDATSQLVTDAGDIAITITNAATVAEVKLIDTDTTGTVVPMHISDTAALLTAADGDTAVALTNNVDGAQITITDGTTLAQIDEIVTDTDATLNYSITQAAADIASEIEADGGQGEAAANLTDDELTTYLDNATSISTSGSLTDIEAIAEVTDTPITATAVNANAADLLANEGGYIVDGVDVTVNNSVSIATITAIDALNGDGTLTLNGVSDTVANLTANVGGYIDGTVDVTITDAATITQIAAIDNVANGVTVTTVQDTAAAIKANVGTYVAGAVDVIVTDSTITAADANTIGGLTTGVVTATLATAAVDTINTALVGNNGDAADELTITINDTTLDAAELAKLVAVDGVTAITIDATSVTSIAGAAADVAAALSADGINFSDSVAITPDFGGSTAQADELLAMDAALEGAVDASTIDTIQGTATDLAAVLNSTGITKMATADGTISAEIAAGAETAAAIIALAAVTVDGSTITVDTVAGVGNVDIVGTVADVTSAINALAAGNDAPDAIVSGSTTPAALTTLDGISNSIDATAVTQITGTVAAIGTALDLTTTPANYEAVLTDTTLAATGTLFVNLDNATVDASSVTSMTGTATNIATDLAAMGTTPTAFTVTISETSVIATDITAIANTDGVTLTLTSAVQTLIGTAAEINEMMTATGTTANFNVALGAASEVATDVTTLAGNGQILLDASLVTELTGTIAEIEAAEAATYSVALKANYNATLTAGTEAAADILAMTTAGTIDATALTEITGTLANINLAIAAVTSPTAYTATLAAGTVAAGALKTLEDVAGTTVDASAITVITGDEATILLDLQTIETAEGTLPTALTITLADGVTVAEILALAEYDGITLDGSALTAAQAFSGSMSDIDDALAAITNMTADYDVAITDTIVSATQLKAYDDANGTGSVAYDAGTGVGLINGSVADLKYVVNQASIVNTGADQNINITDAAGTTVQAADILTIENATDKDPLVENVLNISGNLSDVSDVSTDAVAATSNYIVTDNTLADADGADLNTLNGNVDGIITASITYTTTAGNLVTDTDGVNAYTITVTDATVLATDLKTLADATSITVDASAVTTITGTAEELEALRALTASDITLSDSVTLTQTLATTMTAEDLLYADTNSTVEIDATSVDTLSGTVEDILAVLNAAGISALTALDVVTITDEAGTDIAATDLKTIIEATTDGAEGGASSVTLTNAVNITGDYADIEAVLVDGAGAYIDLTLGATEPTITINDTLDIVAAGAGTAPSIAAADLNAILTATDGVVTATLTGTETELALVLDGAAENALTITLNADLDDPTALTSLLAITAATSGDVTLNSDQALTGDISDLSAILPKLTNTVNVTVDEAASISDTEIAALDADAGTVTIGINITAITGDAADVDAALTATVDAATNDVAVTLSDTAEVPVATITSIYNKTGTGQVTMNVNATITGDAADLVLALDTNSEAVLSNCAITVNDDATSEQIVALDALTTGVITASINDSITELITTNTLTYAAGNVYDITLNNTVTTADAADLLTLADLDDGTDTSSLDASAITEITSDDIADFTGLNADTSDLTFNDNVTLTTTIDATVDNLIVLNNFTEGTVTFDSTTLDANVTDSVADFAAALDGMDSVTTGDLTVDTAAATVDQVNTINTATDGLVDLAAQGIVLTDEATFDLSDLGLLGGALATDGITGLVAIDATDISTNIITITAADLFEANDGANAITLTIDADTLSDEVNLTGWTEGTSNGTHTSYTTSYDNGSTTETYTVNVTDGTVVNV